MDSINRLTKEQVYQRIILRDIDPEKYHGDVSKAIAKAKSQKKVHLKALSKSQLLSIYQKQLGQTKQNENATSKTAVRMKNLDNRLNKDSKREVLLRLYSKQRSDLIVMLGLYANMVYKVRSLISPYYVRCILNKPDLKAAYDAIPAIRRTHIPQYDIEKQIPYVIAALFGTDVYKINCPKEIIDLRPLKELIIAIHKVKVNLAKLM